MSAILPSRMRIDPERMSSSRTMRALENTVSLLMSSDLSAFGAGKRQPGMNFERGAARLLGEDGKAGNQKRPAGEIGKTLGQDRLHDVGSLCGHLAAQRHVKAEILHDVRIT